MAEKRKRNECWTTEIPKKKFSQEKLKPLDDSQHKIESWQEFTDSTTLHGLKYVFKKRPFLVRSIWIVLLVALFAYYVLTVYRAFSKYYSYPINTLVTTKQDLKEMNFPAVTICSHNYFAKSKLYMKDDNPLFASSDLNISLCDITKKSLWIVFALLLPVATYNKHVNKSIKLYKSVSPEPVVGKTSIFPQV